MFKIKKNRPVISRSAEETLALGERLAHDLRPGDIVYVYGALGSGKTVFVKGVCKGLEIGEDVTSPSFILVNEYQGKVPVVHIDLYRLDPDAVDLLPISEYIKDNGITIIEWADRLSQKYLSGICVKIAINKQNNRELKIEDIRH